MTQVRGSNPKTGDDIEFYASDWGGMLDLLRAKNVRSNEQETKAGRNGPFESIRVRPDVDVSQFGIVGLDAPVMTPTDNLPGFKRSVLFTASTPAAGQSMAIMSEPCAAGKIRDAMIGGVTPVQVDVTDENHGYAALNAGDTTQLESADAGEAKIIWKEAGTGTKWAVIQWPVGSAAASDVQAIQVGSNNMPADLSTDFGDLLSFDFLPASNLSMNASDQIVAATPGEYLMTAHAKVRVDTAPSAGEGAVFLMSMSGASGAGATDNALDGIQFNENTFVFPSGPGLTNVPTWISLTVHQRVTVNVDGPGAQAGVSVRFQRSSGTLAGEITQAILTAVPVTPID